MPFQEKKNVFLHQRWIERKNGVCVLYLSGKWIFKKTCQKISLTRLTQLLNFQPSHGKLLIVPKTVTLLGGFIIKPHHSLSKRGGSQYK